MLILVASAVYKEATRYSVDAQGLRASGGAPSAFYPWREVQAYRIVPHRHLPHVGVLQPKTKRFRTVVAWTFRTSQMSEPAYPLPR